MPRYLAFSKGKRSRKRSRQTDETSYAYLDLSARPEAANVRRLVESWFSLWPDSERKDWLGRFRSRDDTTHWGAFFELLLHTWLSRLGFTVIHHPTVPGTEKHPDFLAIHRDGREFYLEARSTDGFSADEARVERFTDQVIAESGPPN